MMIVVDIVIFHVLEAEFVIAFMMTDCSMSNTGIEAVMMGEGFYVLVRRFLVV